MPRPPPPPLIAEGPKVERRGRKSKLSQLLAMDQAQKTLTKQGILQDPGERTKFLLNTHGTQKILEAIDDPTKLHAFSAYDAMLIVGLGNSIKGSGEERERLLNRMFGKVPDKIMSLNVNIDTSPSELSDKASELLARLIE